MNDVKWLNERGILYARPKYGQEWPAGDLWRLVGHIYLYEVVYRGATVSIDFVLVGRRGYDNFLDLLKIWNSYNTDWTYKELD